VSALSVSESELNLALRALRRQFNRELPSRASDRDSSLELLSAILLTVSLKYLEAEGALCNLFADSSRKRKDVLLPADNGGLFSLVSALHAELAEFMPSPIKLKLPLPSKQSVVFAGELFNDVAYKGLWCNSSSIGFVHQVFASAFRKEALEKVQVANKMVAADTLIAFTQIYTPDWVTDFLLSNALLPMVEQTGAERNGDSARFWRWRLHEFSEFPNKKSLDQVRLIDPACGAGNFLLAAYDLLKTLYVQRGIPKETAARQILEKQLFGADIDETGLTVTCLALLTKKLIDAPRATIHLNNIVSSRNLPDSKQPELLGSISRRWSEFPEHVLSFKYDVVVTNPPYVGRRLIGRELKGFLSQEYPLSRSDLAAAFLEGSLELLAEGGRLGVITQSSLLAIPSYRKFREFIHRSFNTLVSVECGSGVFPLLSGEKADSVLLVIENPAGMPALDPVRPPNIVEKLKLGKTLHHSGELFNLVSRLKENPGSNKVDYSKRERASASLKILDQAPQVQTVASVRQGLATTNNARFVRFHWDVDAEELGSIWVPYVKGAGSERWYAPNLHVVKWADNGREIKQRVADAYPYLRGKTAWVVKNEGYYFKPGLCFSFINKSRLAVRRLPKGCIFDVASSAIFARGEEDDFLLGYLNSTLASALVSRINPTINVQVGDVKKIPLPSISTDHVRRICALARACYSAKERLVGFINHPFTEAIKPESIKGANDWQQIWRSKEENHDRLASDLSQLEGKLDRAVMLWVTEILAIGKSDAIELEDWMSERKESLSIKSQFFKEEQLFGKLIHDLVGSMVSARTASDVVVLLPSVIDGGKKNLRQSAFSQTILSASGIDCAETAIFPERAQPLLKERHVLDLAKCFQGPARYLCLRLPHCGALLLLSRRAVSNYMRLSAEEKWRHWIDNFQAFSLIPNEGAVTEAGEVLQKTTQRLKAIRDWTTKDLIAVLNDVLAESK
jgi:hypothetical protein